MRDHHDPRSPEVEDGGRKTRRGRIAGTIRHRLAPILTAGILTAGVGGAIAAADQSSTGSDGQNQNAAEAQYGGNGCSGNGSSPLRWPTASARVPTP